MNSEVWSDASEEGMLAWWSLNESFNPFSVDRVRGRKALFVGLSDSDRVFGKIGNAIRFGGAGEHLIVKGFTGIVDDKSRTISLWVKTSENDGPLIRWGGNGTGRLWELEIRSGAFCLDVGNARLESTLAVNDGAWHHLAVVLPASAERLEDAVLYVDGTIQNVTSTANPVISTGDDYDVIIGSDLSGNNFEGTIDEIRLYERGLSLSEVKSIYLDGTVVFTTSSVAQPPVVELSRVVAEANASVTIVGELLSVDQNDPVVRIYYGLEDGGFSQQDWNNSFVDVNGGSPVVLGDFNATITGLTPGERYYFRAFAQSADGVDWSSGDPEVKSGLLGYWRMDETNGSVLIDSIAPFHNAGLSVLEENRTRTTGYLGRGVYLSGNPDYVNLDLNNTGYLEQSFDGRSVSIWIKPDQEFYTGPTVTKYESLVGYYNFDNQVGSKVNDLSIMNLSPI